jgi:hypothetical protein
LLALIPREGEAPCESLRDVVRWTRTQPKSPVVFDVPGAGRETVARVVLGSHDKQKGKAQSVRVVAGARALEAWVKAGATGQIEIPVPAGAVELSVETSEPSLVRASARAHPPPSLPIPSPSVAPSAVVNERAPLGSRALARDTAAPPVGEDSPQGVRALHRRRRR